MFHHLFSVNIRFKDPYYSIIGKLCSSSFLPSLFKGNVGRVKGVLGLVFSFFFPSKFRVNNIEDFLK